jgi:F0F1-type ATP synthase membrane subunit c/vacuolar-type H+-ATPase subunit K
MRLVVQNLDAIATLIAGLFATYLAWCRGGIATAGIESLGRPERYVGPVLILFAVLKFAISP